MRPLKGTSPPNPFYRGWP